MEIASVFDCETNAQYNANEIFVRLTHCDRVTHICVGKLTIIGSDNGLSLGRRQAIIWTNAGIWLIGPLGTYFSEFLIAIETFSFKIMHLKISSAKWRPFCLDLNVLMTRIDQHYSMPRNPSKTKPPPVMWREELRWPCNESHSVLEFIAAGRQLEYMIICG